MKRFFAIIFSIYLLAPEFIKAQDDKAFLLLKEFMNLYDSGNIVEAENCLKEILEWRESLSLNYLIPTYNNLGAIYQITGRYDEALENYSKAEDLNIRYKTDLNELASIYNNKALIYRIQRSYPLALEYFEKCIRLFLNQNDSLPRKYLNLSASYRNIALTHYDIGKFDLALAYLNKSEELKIKYNLSGLENLKISLANTYFKLGALSKAEKYYTESISIFQSKFGENYFRLAETYEDYSIFLRWAGRNDESLKALKTALSIYLKNYSGKHPDVSRTYNLIGDHYLNLHGFDSALFYFQKSLIAVTKDFNDHDIFTNPPLHSSLFDIQFLAGLKSKANALELLSKQQEDSGEKLRILEKGLETIELAIKLIERIRNNYPSEESKIYLAENEKETYIFATHLVYTLSSVKPDRYKAEHVYNIATRAKAAILRNEISGNELLLSSEVPDSLKMLQKELAKDIAAYNHLIVNERRKTNPDEIKISDWKDALFGMNRRNEEVTSEINIKFPKYQDLLQVTEPDQPDIIQDKLEPDETIVDYLLSNRYENGRRRIYTFIITKNRLECNETSLDSLFALNADIIRKGSGSDFLNYTGALNYMYENLISPSEDFFAGDKVIIIPDEEIAWIPFDAFLKNKPEIFQTDFEGLSYLIHDYAFSYGYSSSLIFGKNDLKKKPEVFSFSPDYNKAAFRGMGLGILNGADEEIGSIYKWFKGKKFTGSDASEENFLKSAENNVVFHLAMHALPDSANSKYSYFLFDTEPGKTDDGKLYNYEISLARLNSPMVVLSACNSGTGTLNEGEGLMSLARGFILAGASSVIKTAWEVNDELSASIITRFYYYLSKGKQKDEAMRLAKLEYLKNVSPTFANPYYWAAYEVMGDNAPITRNRKLFFLFIGLIAVAIVSLFYFRPRRIFSDRLP